MPQYQRLCLFLFLFFGNLPAMAQLPRSVVDPEIVDFMRQKGIPGVAAALYYQGQPFLLNYGVTNVSAKTPVTENTIFEIASITKVFTSTALALEVQKGRMALNAPALNYLPRYRRATSPSSKSLC